MQLYPHQEEAIRALSSEFDQGAQRVRLREKLGLGGHMAVSKFVVDSSAEGRCLVLCTESLVPQAIESLKKLNPDANVGRWGSNAKIVVDSYFKVSRNLEQEPRDAFVLIQLNEGYPPHRRLANAITNWFNSAKCLESLGMPRPHPGLIEVDSDLDRTDTPVHILNYSDLAETAKAFKPDIMISDEAHHIKPR